MCIATLMLMLLGCPEPNWDEVDGCTCAEAKLKHQWCAVCKVGFVAGVRIESQRLYEEIDAHGHDIDPKQFECPTCRQAIASDGFCEKCRMGFVHQKAYMSRLTYYIARGETKDVASIACPACRKNAQYHGWCEACGVGMVGNVAFKSKADFEAASRAYDVLIEAVRTLKRCLDCAVAMVLDGRCPTCKVAYREGLKFQTRP